MIPCPSCGGCGHTAILKFDIIKRIDIPCTIEEYNLLPCDEDEAEELGRKYCKQDIDICPTCRGDGEIFMYF
jgi:hypothetical protein